MLNFLFVQEIFAKSLKCDFEEVYKNGQVQKGYLLIKDDSLRYQYYDKNLYTLIYNHDDLFMINNSNPKEFQNINRNKNLIIELLEVYKKFPNILPEYKKDEFYFKIEKNNNGSFIKRIAIVSNKLNMSIYFTDCNFKPINDIFFKHDPVFDYIGK